MIDLLGSKRRRKEIELRERELALAEKQADIEDRKVKQQRAIVRMMHDEQARKEVEKTSPLAAPVLLPSVVPEGVTAPVAMDSCSPIYDYAAQGVASFYGSFPGYPALASMSQSSDYRSVAETTATEMTREWGQFKVVDPDTDSSLEQATDAEREQIKEEKKALADARQEKINQITEAFESFGIRALIRKAIEVEMGMGRAQIYVDLGSSGKDDIPFVMSEKGVGKGSLKGFRLIEPMWSTPSVYNANDPTAEDFYRPTQWFVLGRPIHADRLRTLIMRPVPDILKPAYNFGGISMFQLMKPYVERYQRTADSISWVVQAFSLTILATDMSGILAGGENASNLWVRAGLLNQHRENSGTLLLDKESEEISQVNTPLTGLHELLTKSQEQMAGPSHTPLVKLLGITPAGLNANSDGEIRVYYDYIMAQNEAHVRPIICWFSDLIQLDLFGKIDPTIKWEFNPLYQLDEKEKAEVQEIKMRTAKDGVDGGIISHQEARNTLSKDENSPYNGIDVDDVPDGEMIEDDSYDDEKDQA